MAVRIGIVTQRNLAKLCAQKFSPFTRYVFWFAMELAIIGSDIQEVLGTATALSILFGLSMQVGVIVTVVDSFIFLFLHYFGVRILELFFALLILVMAISFGTNMIQSEPDVSELLYGTFVPTIPEGGLSAA